MIVEIELAVIILLVAPWATIRQTWHRWRENKKLAAEHIENERARWAAEHARVNEV
jgi:hypothetical protein